MTDKFPESMTPASVSVPVRVSVGMVTVPVKVGLFKGALLAKSDTKLVTWDSVKVLAESAVLFTLPSPTIAAVIPETVPVKVGLLIGALLLIVVVKEVPDDP